MLLCLLLGSGTFAQESTAEMIARADIMFENEQYVEATPLYLHALSLDPTVAPLNFKYGACLLFNSGNKSEAIRYLNFGAADPNCDPRAHYFRGRALHLDYQFDAAKKSYQAYLGKRSKFDARYPVEREIQMCENGKHLLSTFTEIIVTQKKQIPEAKFYEIYSDSKTIGGQIIVNYDFQSKIDKKKGHVPTVHIAPDARRIFYASYGDNEDTGKDIYMRTKLPNGKWSEPQLAPGGVNTSEDEEYPFLHASGKYLYFSSKGHNSMGGFDVFMCRYNAETNQFGPAENVDFAISSPDDDLFYVVDSAYQNAYFASARSSESGKLHVYKVKVARVPLQEVIVMGDFKSDLHPESQKVVIQLVKHSNGTDLDKIRADAAKGGKYSYVFPQGGKYDYIIDVEGSGAQYRFTVELPFLDEFRPLKQLIIHTEEDGKEIVRLINKFDEDVEGAEAIIAEVIRKKSALDVNVDQFDLKEIETSKENGELLATLGFNQMSIEEVQNQLQELSANLKTNSETTKRIQANIASELLVKSDRVKQLHQMEEELRSTAQKATDPIVKHKLLTEASQKMREKETLIQQINGLEMLLQDVDKLASTAANPEKLAAIEQQFNELLTNDTETAALEYLVAEKTTLEEAKSSSPKGIQDNFVKETIEIRSKLKSLSTQKNEFAQTIQNIDAKINRLERERETAKKKEQEQIDSDIAAAKEEQKLTQSALNGTVEQISDLEERLNLVEEQLASYQNAMSTEETAQVTVKQALDAGKEIEQIENGTNFDYAKELTQLESDHPEINGGAPIENWSAKIEEENTQKNAQIKADPNLTELEKAARLLDNNETTIAKINKQLAAIDARKDGSNNVKIQEQKTALFTQKKTFSAETEGLKERVRELKQETPDAALSKEDVLAELIPDFQKSLDAIEANTTLDDRSVLEQKKALQEQLAAKIEADLEASESILKKNPEDEEARARKELLDELKVENSSTLNEIQMELDALPPATTPVTSTEVIATIDPEYSQRKEDIAQSDASPQDKTTALLRENENLQAALKKEVATVDKQLRKTPSDPALQERKDALLEAQSVLDAEIAENKQTLAALNSTPTETFTQESIVNNLVPNYGTEKAAIDQSDATPLQKAEQTLALDEQLDKALAVEIKRLEKEVKKNPNDPNLNKRLATTKETQATLTNTIASERQTIETLKAGSQPLATKESVVNALVPNYETEKASIDQSDATPLEKAQQALALDQQLETALVAEMKRLEKEVKKNPNDENLAAQMATTNEVLTATRNEITARKETIKQLNDGSTAVATTETVVEELAPNYEADMGAIDRSSAGPAEKAIKKASLESELIEKLTARAATLEKEMERTPENEALKNELEVVQNALNEKNTSLERFKREATELLTAEEKEIVIEGVAPNYFTEKEAASNREERIKAEENLQASLTKAIEENAAKLRRKYTVTADLENRILEKLLAESKNRVANDTQETLASESSFIEQLRTESGQETTAALTVEETSLTALKEQDAVLALYEAKLNERINTTEAAVQSAPTNENKAELNWLTAEKERVVKKRRAVQVTIGELETTQIAGRTEDPETQTLNEEVQRIRNELQAEDLSPTERKQLKQELAKVEQEQLTRENRSLEADLDQDKTAIESLQADLRKDLNEDPNNSVTSASLRHAETEQAAIDDLKIEASNAKTEAERNYLLEKAQQRSDRLNDELQEARVDNQLSALEETYDISTASPEELEKKRRHGYVQIGEISREIERVKTEIEQAKKKEIPALIQEKEGLEARKAKLEAEMQQIETQLAKKETTPDALDPKALEENISFNEERKLASSDGYKEYQEAATEALLVANEIRNLEEELGIKRAELQRMVRSGEDEGLIALKAKEIQTIENEIDRKRIDLTQKKYTAEQALPENKEEAMKMQNLVARGIQPLKIAAVASTILQMPSNGFAIDTSSSRPNNGVLEIPVGVKSPEGLVYRVQVGAFARPLREDVFKEFNPVSGEKIEGTNITRYMAGYFNSGETVRNAQTQIRALGYSDAFIVAYCNGERVTFGEALRLEAAGICVPKRTEEIMIAVTESTAQNLNIPMSTEVVEVPEWTYNEAPGAAPADPIEKLEGLFFTVQVGVFNRPVSPSELYDLPNLSTFRLPNGQIRYNSGIYDSAEEAVPRQNFARQSGIQGAFIVAYYQGERISIGNARRLLNELGQGILQSRMEMKDASTPVKTVRTDSVTTKVVEIVPMEEWEKRVQIVTEKTFNEFPRDVLNRYNAEGSFYYDAVDKKVKSVIYKNEEYLPNLRNFKDDIDTIYLEVGVLDDERTEILVMTFTDSLLPGDFMDWMLRCQYRRTMRRNYKGVEVKIFGILKADMDEMIEQIKRFGVLPERVLETEEKEN